MARPTRVRALAACLAGSMLLAACSGGACPTPAPASAAGVATAASPAANTALSSTATPEPVATPSGEPPTQAPGSDAPRSDVPPSEPAILDPCSLISRDEAAALVGGSLRKPMPAGQPPTLCMWPTPLSGAVRQVQIDLGDGVVKFLEIDRDTLGHAFTQPAGIGDEAWFEPGNVFFRVGEQWVGIHTVGGPGGAKGERRLLDLARIVASRL